MKIFDERENKVNFADENNVVVGYDLSQDCCEHADWYLSYEEESEDRDNDFKDNIEDYTFDTSYFVKQDLGGEYGEGGLVRFKLDSAGKKPIFLHLFNSHNGYYSHGFESKIGNEDWKNDYI